MVEYATTLLLSALLLVMTYGWWNLRKTRIKMEKVLKN